MSMKDSLMREVFSDETTIFHYCISLQLKNSLLLNYTTAERDIALNGQIYSSGSGLNLINLHTNEGGQDYLDIELFKDLISSPEVLLDAEAKIMIYFVERNIALPYYTMYVTKILDNALKLVLKLEPITIKLQKTLLSSYSKTCRAEFCDIKCKVAKNSFSTNFEISSIEGYNIKLTNCNKDSGYYSAGEAIFAESTHFNIINHTHLTIKLDRPIPSTLKGIKSVTLVAGCDKKFTTCCNKFNNAINFRGEPCVPGNKILNIK